MGMIRMEIYRAFHSKGTKISFGAGFLLALEHFIFRVVPDVSGMFDSYHPDLAFTIVRNLHGEWMAGMGGAENNIYQTIVYLLITIPYAGSYYTDKTRGILKNIVARCDKKNYLIAKSAAVFLSAGTAAVFPLLVSLLLTATVMPLVNYDWLQMPYPTAIFIRELLVNPVLYYLLYMAVIFVTAGLVAGLSLTVSIYANNVFVVLSMPFLICIVISRLLSYMGNGFIRGLSITRIFNMCQNVPPNFVSMAVLACILFVSGYMAFVVKGVKKDVL